MGDPCVDQPENARHRPLRTAAETQRLEELGQCPLVLRSAVDDDDVGPRIAESLRGFDERSRIGRPNARDDLGAGRDSEMNDGQARRLLAAMNERDAKRPPERDARLLDGDPYPDRGPYPLGFGPGRDRYRAAVVVRAASWTKASNTPSTSGDIP